jgi:hypothetical protein
MKKLFPVFKKVLPALEFAVEKQCKLPLQEKAHVRSALVRFTQVKGVSIEERNEGWRRILDADKKFGVDIHDTSWRDLQTLKKLPLAVLMRPV